MAKAPAPIGHNLAPPTADIMVEKHPRIFQRLNDWLRKAKRADLDPKTLDDCAKLDALFKEGRDVANDADGIRETEKSEPLRLCREIDAVFNIGVRDKVGVKGGMAEKISKASATLKAKIDDDRRAAAAAEEEKLRAQARKAEEDALAKEEAGKTKLADVASNKADALHDAADAAAAQADKDISQSTKMNLGGVTSSVQRKKVCTGIIRAKLDVTSILPFIKEEHLIAAVNAFLSTGQTSLEGAIIEDDIRQRIR